MFIFSIGGTTYGMLEYTTWLKWVGKVIVTIAIVNIIILTIVMTLL